MDRKKGYLDGSIDCYHDFLYLRDLLPGRAFNND